jgi:hypothetical protein
VTEPERENLRISRQLCMSMEKEMGNQITTFREMEEPNAT